MKARIWMASIAVALGVQVAPALAVSDAEILASACFGCHGTDGDARGEIPKIIGEKPGFIKRRMLDYRSGEKVSTLMDRISKGYTDAQIEAIDNFITKGQ